MVGSSHRFHGRMMGLGAAISRSLLLAGLAVVFSMGTGAQSTAQETITLTPLDSVIIDETDVETGVFTVLQLVGFEPADASGCGPVEEPAACGTEYLSVFDPPLVIFPEVIGSGETYPLFTHAGSPLPGTFMRYSFQGITPSVTAQIPMSVVSAIPSFTISLPFDSSLANTVEVIDYNGNVTFWESGVVIPSQISEGVNIDLFGDGSWYFTRQTNDPLSAEDFQPHATIQVPEPSTKLGFASGLVLLGALAALRTQRRARLH